MHNKTTAILIKQLYKLQKLFPIVAARIETRWGILAGHLYLQELLIKHRPNRHGFPEYIFQLIMCIYLLHVSEFGDFGIPLILTMANVESPEIEHDVVNEI